jgi:YidC/Oxa1 family membrane protein insertase
VLPLLMGASMLVQQWLNPQPLDDLQKKVMYALPVVFTVMFLWFPSGLVLYWVVQNVLSIAQQWSINRAVTAKT